MVANTYVVNKYMGGLIQAFCEAQDPKIKMWVTGAKKVEGAEEWISYRLLADTAATSRRAYSDNHLFFEIACFAKHGHLRKDNLINRPWQMAELFAPLVHQMDYVIESSCLRFKEARMIYQDARSIGAFAQNIQQQSPQLDIHSVHIEVEAVITEAR